MIEFIKDNVTYIYILIFSNIFLDRKYNFHKSFDMLVSCFSDISKFSDPSGSYNSINLLRNR